MHVEVRREVGGYVLRVDGSEREEIVADASLLPTLELVLYDAFVAHLSHRTTILHAGGVVLDGRLLVFVGESGEARARTCSKRCGRARPT